MEFFSHFDVRTSALLVAIAFFIQSFAIGGQAYLIREYEGMGTALLGNLSMAIGFTLLIFRGALPDFLTIVMANTLTIVSPILFYIAISQFTGQKYNVPFIVCIVVITASLLIYYRYVINNLDMRVISISLIAALCALMIAYKFWQVRHASYRFSMSLMFIPFIIYGIFLIARAVVTIISPVKQQFTNTPVEATTYLLLFVISFMWTIGFILMVSQRLQIDLTELATIDSLTRIPNRYATEAFFEKEMSRVQRGRGEFSILLLDIDNFKKINDTHGHTVGDHVLIKTAKTFLSSIRKQDFAGRWGGEEFLIVMPDASAKDARSLAERIRLEVAHSKYRYTKISIEITVSIGIASSKSVDHIDQILKKADEALYMAKATKNAAVMAT